MESLLAKARLTDQENFAAIDAMRLLQSRESDVIKVRFFARDSFQAAFYLSSERQLGELLGKIKETRVLSWTDLVVSHVSLPLDYLDSLEDAEALVFKGGPSL